MWRMWSWSQQWLKWGSLHGVTIISIYTVGAAGASWLLQVHLFSEFWFCFRSMMLKNMFKNEGPLCLEGRSKLEPSRMEQRELENLKHFLPPMPWSRFSSDAPLEVRPRPAGSHAEIWSIWSTSRCRVSQTFHPGLWYDLSHCWVYKLKQNKQFDLVWFCSEKTTPTKIRKYSSTT